MQTLLVEEITLTFADDAHALVKGFGKILVAITTPLFDFVTVPIERIAMACDVAGVYARRRQAERRQCPLDRLNPFKGLRHLT